jgi:hypothetical protein
MGKVFSGVMGIGREIKGIKGDLPGQKKTKKGSRCRWCPLVIWLSYLCLFVVIFSNSDTSVMRYTYNSTATNAKTLLHFVIIFY